MKYHYKKCHQLIAYILIISLFLQSCGQSIYPNVSPANKDKNYKSITNTTASSKPINSENKEVIIQRESCIHLACPEPVGASLDHTFKPELGIQNTNTAASLNNPKKDAKNIQAINSTNFKNKLKIICPLASQQQPVKRVSNLATNLLLGKAFKTKEGYGIKFYQEVDKWRAKVTERNGSLSRTLHLPVYIQEADWIEKVLKGWPISVVQPEKTDNKQGYVYIGTNGLKGGSSKDAKFNIRAESQRTEEQRQQRENQVPGQMSFGTGREAGLKVQAENGDVNAQFQLGKAAYNKWKQNKEEIYYKDVREWLQKAADQGHGVAHTLLREMDSQVASKEEEEMEEEVEDASYTETKADSQSILMSYIQKGDVDAIFELGQQHYNNWMSYQDDSAYREAETWLQKAAAAGHEEASNLLKNLCEPLAISTNLSEQYLPLSKEELILPGYIQDVLSNFRQAEDYELGTVSHMQDSFFDALAQSLNSTAEAENYTPKFLRIRCSNSSIELEDEEVQTVRGDKGKAKKNNIEYTFEECEASKKPSYFIPGSPQIEGRILCHKLNLDGIGIIKLEEFNGLTQPISSYMVSKEGYRDIPITEEEQIRDLLASRIPIIIQVSISGEIYFLPLIWKNKKLSSELRLVSEALQGDDDDRLQLAEDILSTTEAEPDVRLNVYHYLKDELKEFLTGDVAFRGEFNKLFVLLEEPELMVDRNLYNQEAMSTFEDLSTKVFQKLEQAIQQINFFKEEVLASKIFNTPELQEKLESLAQFYVQSKDKLSKAWENPRKFNSMLEPRALMMGEWWPYTFYRITQMQACYLCNCDNFGKLIPPQPNASGNTSNHAVCYLPKADARQAKVYFKLNGQPALNPSREYMLYSLYKNLNISVPASGIIILDNLKRGEQYWEGPFILQASQAIHGHSGKKVVKEDMRLKLDTEHFSRQIVGTLLTSPSDAKADNFMVTSIDENKWAWVGIDNDEVFTQPIVDTDRVHLKSILLFLADMKSVLAFSTELLIKYLNPSLVILEWLLNLKAQTSRYLQLKRTLAAHGQSINKFKELDPDFGINPSSYIRKGGKLSNASIQDLFNSLRLPFSDLTNSILSTIHGLLADLQRFVQTKKEEINLWNLFEYTYPHISRYYKNLQDQVNQSASSKPLDELDDTITSPPYEALKLLWMDEISPIASLRVDEAEPLREEAYFRTEYSGEASDIIEQQIKSYLNSNNINIDEIINAYNNWLEAEPDNEKKIAVFQKALHSLQVLQHHGLFQIQNPQIVIELYQKGKLLSEKISNSQLSAWESIFGVFKQHNQALVWQMNLVEYFLDPSKEEAELPYQDSNRVYGASMGNRLLSPQLRNTLLDAKGEFTSSLVSSYASRSGVLYPAEKSIFFFEPDPVRPLHAYAVTSFMQSFGLELVPHTELLVFHGTQAKPYPLLLTQVIKGEPLGAMWQSSYMTELNTDYVHLLMLSYMLLGLKDKNENDFLLTEGNDKLVLTNNEHTFVESFRQKHLLFCLPEMNKPLSENLRQQLIGLKPDLFLNNWLTDLIQTNARLERQLTSEENTVELPLFSKSYMQNLCNKFYRLNTLLQHTSSITPLLILKNLKTNVEPEIFNFYNTPDFTKHAQERYDALKSISVEEENEDDSELLNAEQALKLLPELHNDAIIKIIQLSQSSKNKEEIPLNTPKKKKKKGKNAFSIRNFLGRKKKGANKNGKI